MYAGQLSLRVTFNPAALPVSPLCLLRMDQEELGSRAAAGDWMEDGGELTGQRTWECPDLETPSFVGK